MNEVLTAVNVVTLTANAVGEVKSLLTKPENAGKHMRFYVEQGGCSGMQYGMIFDEQRDGDRVADHDGVTVLVDAISAQYLRGTVVDFSDALTGGGFKITNPNAKQSCGCGKSFEA
jgi:iron-sulfur cluster assembly accessory protein